MRLAAAVADVLRAHASPESVMDWKLTWPLGRDAVLRVELVVPLDTTTERLIRG